VTVRYTSAGLIQLGLMLILGRSWIGFIIAGIWALIEGIHLLLGRFTIDADGATSQRWRRSTSSPGNGDVSVDGARVGTVPSRPPSG
jgi:hypothetical protein